MSKDRFKDALWYKKSASIIVGGSGGIGSWFTFFAARAGFPIQLFDFDVVEEHNIGGQMFLASSVGQTKVDAIADTIALFNDSEFSLTTYTQRIDEDTRLNDNIYSNLIFIVSAFDNMLAREHLFNEAKRLQEEYQHKSINFIDGRLLMEQMRIYCIDLSDNNAVYDYETNHLFPDSDVDDVACTMKQVSHGAAMIASHMFGFVTNIITNNHVWGNKTFRVPYMWDYIIPTNTITEVYEPAS